ncbi:hypothetical protein NQ314_002125 [Rhamnusium bicolor]|uniref:Uncharacterized protein n=1 Tax=Rhamnusium bicolor TaxID=1586634 RepID=A0AAV8ZSE3_9CUCU|nr:hypothetical protein NQ314_002125 [Rhamnusium bicolor]
MTHRRKAFPYPMKKRITLMLIAVVVLFIICHTPTASMLIYQYFHKFKTAREENITLSKYSSLFTIITKYIKVLLSFRKFL